MPSKPIFEVQGRDGHRWKIYEDGRIEGFPAGSIVINRIRPKLDSLRGMLMSEQVAQEVRRNG